MKIIEHITDYKSRSDVFTLYPLMDIHLGTRACDEERLDHMLDEIARDKYGFYLLGGDNVDCINAKDPRFDPRLLPPWLLDRWVQTGDLAAAQREELIARLTSRDGLRGKCLGVVEGNHETAIYRHTETNVYDPLVEALRVDGESLALGYEGFIVWRFRRLECHDTWTVVIYVNHGWGGGDLAGGIALKLERQMDRFDADVYLLGHHHKIQSIVQSRPLRVNAGLHLEQPPDRIGAVCGSFIVGRLENIGTYPEAKGYRLTPRNGQVLVKITPDKKRIELVERVIHDAAVM